MLPVLFEPFGLEVRSYGVMLVLGILLAVWWSRRRAPRWGIEPDRILDATFWGVVPGILGARIGYIVQEWGYYSQHPEEIWTLRFEGLTSFGGVLFALLGLIVFARRAKISGWAFLDVVAAPLLVAHAVGRVGCLLNGCCYGHPTDAWYGVSISPGVATLFEPAQIYEGFLVMVGVGLLLLFERKRRALGTSFAFALLVWGGARFIYEFFRAGTEEEVARGLASSTYWGTLPLTQAHVAAVVMVLVGAFVWLFVSRAKRPQTEESAA